MILKHVPLACRCEQPCCRISPVCSHQVSCWMIDGPRSPWESGMHFNGQERSGSAYGTQTRCCRGSTLIKKKKRPVDVYNARGCSPAPLCQVIHFPMTHDGRVETEVGGPCRAFTVTVSPSLLGNANVGSVFERPPAPSQVHRTKTHPSGNFCATRTHADAGIISTVLKNACTCGPTYPRGITERQTGYWLTFKKPSSETFKAFRWNYT